MLGKTISEGCWPSFFSVIPGFNQPLHISSTPNSLKIKKKIVIKEVNYQKKKHFTYRQPDGEEHLGFKDSGNN